MYKDNPIDKLADKLVDQMNVARRKSEDTVLTDFQIECINTGFYQGWISKEQELMKELKEEKQYLEKIMNDVGILKEVYPDMDLSKLLTHWVVINNHEKQLIKEHIGE
jgi:hypothetical protein